MARPKLEDRPVAQTNEISGRPVRVPINGDKKKFDIQPQEAGWHYFVANDDQVEDYIAGGYEFVTHRCKVGGKMMNQSQGMTSSKISFPVGNGVTGFVLRCTNEIYEEELKLVHDKADLQEANMKEALNSRADGRYGKVKFEDKVIDPTRSPD